METDKKTKRISCPSWLNAEAKKEWRRLYKVLEESGKQLNSRDIKTLEIYCLNYSKFRKCEAVLEKEGLTFKTATGYIQQRPEESISIKAQEKMIQCSKELGLTPAARARMEKNNGSNSSGGIDPELEEMIS